jgi:hypothetical protein
MSEALGTSPTVVLLGTLDTKAKEYAYVRDRIRERGVDVRSPHTRREASTQASLAFA